MAKRARGILSREVKKGDGEAGRAVQRFLGGVTWKGVLCQFETVDALCKRVYELADTYGLAHSMLTHLAAGALASGHDVIVCPSPLFPRPDGAPAHPQPVPGLCQRLPLPPLSQTPLPPHPAGRHGGRGAAAPQQGPAQVLPQGLRRPGGGGRGLLAQAKAMHDELEGLYNPPWTSTGSTRQPRPSPTSSPPACNQKERLPRMRQPLLLFGIGMGGGD